MKFTPPIPRESARSQSAERQQLQLMTFFSQQVDRDVTDMVVDRLPVCLELLRLRIGIVQKSSSSIATPCDKADAIVLG